MTDDPGAVEVVAFDAGGELDDAEAEDEELLREGVLTVVDGARLDGAADVDGAEDDELAGVTTVVRRCGT